MLFVDHVPSSTIRSTQETPLSAIPSMPLLLPGDELRRKGNQGNDVWGGDELGRHGMQVEEFPILMAGLVAKSRSPHPGPLPEGEGAKR